MTDWRLLLTHGLTVFNILFACYFVAGNRSPYNSCVCSTLKPTAVFL